MKRMICTLAAFAMLVLVNSPAQAEYTGTLQGDQLWLLEIDSGSVSTIAVTIFYLGKSLDVGPIVSVPTGTTVQLADLKIPKGTRRIIIEVDPPGTPGCVAAMRVVQGSIVYSADICAPSGGESSRFVLDVV
jgi:hypothetical protein